MSEHTIPAPISEKEAGMTNYLDQLRQSRIQRLEWLIRIRKQKSDTDDYTKIIDNEIAELQHFLYPPTETLESIR